MAREDYLCSLPSKGYRGKLIQALNVWYDASAEETEAIRSTVDDIHNLSLMLDDVQDSSPLRRGKPATHVVFGLAQTVNSATYQIVEVVSRSLQRYGEAFTNVVLEEMKNILVGQGVDLFWTHDVVSSPSVDEYLHMVDGKTGGLFRMVSRLLALQSQPTSAGPDLDHLMTLFGRLFQIRDDYANLAIDQYKEQKGFCEDLDEGKISYILIKAFGMADQRQRTIMRSLLQERAARRCSGREYKELLLAIMEESGAMAHTGVAVGALCDASIAEIRKIEETTGKTNPMMVKIVESLRL
ncbi:terpenoid synthase [Xylariaceae sp. FL0594]|nr:terpenoid synthase [Xylariaceae sp. FL0594]